jgi:hypothetical protein
VQSVSSIDEDRKMYDAISCLTIDTYSIELHKIEVDLRSACHHSSRKQTSSIFLGEFYRLKFILDEDF